MSTSTGRWARASRRGARAARRRGGASFFLAVSVGVRADWARVPAVLLAPLLARRQYPLCLGGKEVDVGGIAEVSSCTRAAPGAFEEPSTADARPACRPPLMQIASSMRPRAHKSHPSVPRRSCCPLSRTRPPRARPATSASGDSATHMRSASTWRRRRSRLYNGATACRSWSCGRRSCRRSRRSPTADSPATTQARCVCMKRGAPPPVGPANARAGGPQRPAWVHS